MNTRLEYLYRDAGNYKQWGEVVLAGGVSVEQIKPFLDEGMYFIPQAVGLKGLAERFGEQGVEYPCEDDHPWHELISLSPCDEHCSTEVSAMDLVQSLSRCHAQGWDKIAAAQLARAQVR